MLVEAAAKPLPQGVVQLLGSFLPMEDDLYRVPALVAQLQRDFVSVRRSTGQDQFLRVSVFGSLVRHVRFSDFWGRSLDPVCHRPLIPPLSASETMPVEPRSGTSLPLKGRLVFLPPPLAGEGARTQNIEQPCPLPIMGRTDGPRRARHSGRARTTTPPPLPTHAGHVSWPVDTQSRPGFRSPRSCRESSPAGAASRHRVPPAGRLRAEESASVLRRRLRAENGKTAGRSRTGKRGRAPMLWWCGER